jgi:glycerol uptake facilitator protein
LWAAIVGFPSDLALPGRNGYFWIPIVGPILGGIVGAVVYEFTVHQALLAKGVPPSGTAVEDGRTVREPAGG